MEKRISVLIKNKLLYSLIKDDLTLQDTNVIVNAANSDLWLGSGVAGAIRRKAGNSLQSECSQLIKSIGRELNNGEVAITGIGEMKNENLKYIFHAVGPIYRDGNRGEDMDLFNAFYNCFKKANEQSLSIAIPPISSGVFGYPKNECAKVFYETLIKFIEENEELNIPEIRMTIIDDLTYSEFVKVHEEYIEKLKLL